jgi:NADPH:quinone reductase-like Zn-dependent oxidoreductase
MRALVLTGYGGRDQLRVQDVPEPERGPAEALVEMAASGLNRLDVFVRQGLSGPGVRQPRGLPHVMGAEGAGTVLEVGPQAQTDLVPGDQVIVFPGLSCGHCRYCRRGETSRCAHYAILGEDVWGVQRERVALPVTSLLRVPPGMTLAEAAAVPTTYTTAWTMLVTAGRIRVGERVLVVGGSGGVSIAAMQIAAAAGAQVWATTRDPQKGRRLAELPYVHHVLDGAAPGWAQSVLEATGGEGVDAVVDSVGAPTWPDSIQSLAPGGRLLICGATGGDRSDFSIRELYQSHRQILGAPFGGWNDFRDVVTFLERTGIRPLLHAVLPMEEAAEAHRVLEDQEHVGKVVLEIG